MTRIIINLNDEERDALRLLAEKELRGFRDQARDLLRSQLLALCALVYNPAPVVDESAQARPGTM